MALEYCYSVIFDELNFGNRYFTNTQIFRNPIHIGESVTLDFYSPENRNIQHSIMGKVLGVNHKPQAISELVIEPQKLDSSQIEKILMSPHDNETYIASRETRLYLKCQ